MLLAKGFERIKTSGTRYLRILADNFAKITKSCDDGIEEVEMEDY